MHVHVRMFLNMYKNENYDNIVLDFPDTCYKLKRFYTRHLMSA